MTGFYLHVPFCHERCPFCDYYSVSHMPPKWSDRYTDAIIKQLDGVPKEVDTLYAGGGTPLCLGVSNWKRLVSYLPKARERTIELNPEDIKPENMPVLENFTRLSIGVQSFSDNVLSVLKRSKVGFSTLLDLKTQWQISVDLLIGVPRQTREDVKRDILSVVALGIPHISVYPLEIHEGTPFWSVYNDWDWDDADLMLEIEQFLTERGYEHYEISNYARPGYQCLHNKIYWHDEDYYALGPSAAGYVGGVRYKWISNIRHYIESIEQNKEPPYEEYEEMSLEDQLSEYAIMNLRLLQEGIRRQDVENRFGPSAWDTLVKQANGNTFLSVSDSSIKVSNWLFFNRAAESFV